MLLIGRVLSSQYLKGVPIFAFYGDLVLTSACVTIASSRVAFGWVRLTVISVHASSPFLLFLVDRKFRPLVVFVVSLIRHVSPQTPLSHLIPTQDLPPPWRGRYVLGASVCETLIPHAQSSALSTSTYITTMSCPVYEDADATY